MNLGRDEVGLRSETVRRANLSAIVRALHEAGPLSRSELVSRTGLTRSAIRGLIGELGAAGLVVEDGHARLGTPGRPSPLVRLDPEGAVVLALEIAVDSIAAAHRRAGRHGPRAGPGGPSARPIVGRRGRGRRSGRSSRPDRRPQADGRAGQRDRRGRRRRRPRRADGLVSMAPNLGWIDVPLGERLAAALDTGVPDLGRQRGRPRASSRSIAADAAVGVDDVLYISGEVGVGGGLIVDGRPLTGAAGYGGEVGHVPVDPAGSACRCGSVGCWETEVGEGALLRLAGHRRRRRPGGGRRPCSARRATARLGALAALDQVGRWLGIGLAGLVNILDPRLIVLGGLFGRIHPFVIATRSSASWTGERCAAPRGPGPGRRRRVSAWTPRCSARPSSRSSRFSRIPRPGSGHGMRSPWR